jgi:hypothetical protein
LRKIVITGVFFVSILRFSRSIGRNSRILPIALTRFYCIVLTPYRSNEGLLYNTIRKEIFNKSKPKTIIALLRILKDNGFVYRTRVSVKKDKTNNTISRKLL